MCKPAAEVANVTKLESHSTRGRVMMMWRIAEDMITWQRREVELVYQSTLDSISEAFDVFHYPLSQYMLDARADIWEAGLAPACVTEAVEASTSEPQQMPSEATTLLLAGEIAQLGDTALLPPMEAALKNAGVQARSWVVSTGALAYALGAFNVAKVQAEHVVEHIEAGGIQTIIADGPETAWALTKIYPALGIDLPNGVTVTFLSTVLAPPPQASLNLGKVLVHDSRPACLIADQMAISLAILPGYREDEAVFGLGEVYEAPRRLLDSLGVERVFSTWTRSLAKSSGADDGLWLTYPDLAAGLARERLDYAIRLDATAIVTDSPLAASSLARHAAERNVQVKLLAELLA